MNCSVKHLLIDSNVKGKGRMRWGIARHGYISSHLHSATHSQYKHHFNFLRRAIPVEPSRIRDREYSLKHITITQR
jgi:hypothetical protein